LSKLKSARRRLERIWSRTRSSQDLKLFRSAINSYHSAIIRAKKVFNSSLISSSSSSDPRTLWHSINKLLHRKPISQLPSAIDSKSLPNMFAAFFSEKILKIYSALKSHVPTSPHIEPRCIPTNLTFFTPATEEEIFKLISQSFNSFCDLDPIPTSLLKQCLPVLLPTITSIVNLSLSSGVFPKQFKLSCHSSSEKMQSG